MMKNLHRAAAVLFLLSFSLFLLNGCFSFSSLKKSTRKLSRSFSIDTGGLKKKVAFLVLESPTSSGSASFDEMFVGNFLESVKRQCPSIIPILPGDSQYPEEMHSLPRTASGSMDRLALARIGRLRGINAVVSTRIAAVEVRKEQRGMLWYKDLHHMVEIGVRGEVYDTETGAKLLDEGFRHSIEVAVGQDETVGPETMKDPALFQKALPLLAVEMAGSVCDAIRSVPWKGFVTSISGNRFSLSAGNEVGLRTGQILAVYDSTQTIAGASGERFFLPGKKIGEVKITDLSPGHAEGDVLSDQGIKVGSSVRSK
jgi:hypothetical protein